MPLNENNIIKNDTGRYPNEDSGFFHAQNQYHAVSLSGGKDSTALLLLMIERGMPIDAVISADTGMEFPEMYDHLAKVDDYLFRERGRLERIETDILNNFKRLGVKTEPLNGMERLALLHGMLHIGECEPFHFSWDWLPATGLSVKDFIAPSSFEFRNGYDFRMGEKYAL
jgi:hypothetical protein